MESVIPHLLLICFPLGSAYLDPFGLISCKLELMLNLNIFCINIRTFFWKPNKTLFIPHLNYSYTLTSERLDD